MKKSLFVDVIALLIILLFVYAASSKLFDYQKFRAQLGQSPLLNAFAGWFAWLVPATELVISLMLANRKFRLNGLYAAFCLMVMFTAYIIIITRFSQHVPCSCGGILQKMNWNQHLVFNCIFTALAFSGILLYSDDHPAPAPTLLPA